MSESFEFDVFLSHSSKDKPVVRELAERLRADGLRVWFDEWEIRPGDHIQAMIEQGLETSRVLVLCMSENAFGSDWAQLEAGTFRFRDPLNRERRFLPLRLDDAPIRSSLAPFLYIDWRREARLVTYRKLREACGTGIAALQRTASGPVPGRKRHVVLLDGNTDWIGLLAWSPDGRYFAAGGSDGKVSIWEAETGRKWLTLEGHTKAVDGVAWSPEGLLASCG